MDGNAGSRLEDYTNPSKFVVYVNPRQYDRIMRRRMERDRFMLRRGRPKPVYVPIAVREFSLRLLQSEGALSLDRKRSHAHPGAQAGAGANMMGQSGISIYINQPSAFGGLNASVGGLGGNMNYVYNGCPGVFGCGLGAEGASLCQSLGMAGLDSFSPRAGVKQSLGQGYGADCQAAALYAREAGYCPRPEPERDTIVKFEQLAAQNELYRNYESFLINASLASAAAHPGLAQAGVTNLNGVGSLGARGAGFAGCAISAFPAAVGACLPCLGAPLAAASAGSSSNSSVDKESSRDRDTSSVCSLNSREEIKNNYLHLSYSPFSDSSIDSEIVPKTEPIYNINEQGIVIDAGPEPGLAAGASNPPLFEGEFLEAGAVRITENVQDYSYVANRSFLENGRSESYDTHLHSILGADSAASLDAADRKTNSVRRSTINSATTINEHLLFNTANASINSATTSISSSAGAEDGGVACREGAGPRAGAREDGAYLYRQLYNCF